MKNKGEVHQTFLPKGFLGAVDDNPYKLDVAKAKELLAKAGLPDGFTVTMDIRIDAADHRHRRRRSSRRCAQAGIKIEIIPGDGKQTLTKYRARQHDIYIGNWGSDYQDPHTNADTFAANADNSDDAKAKPLAWRNAWDPGPLTAKTRAAVLERDAEKRAAMYKELQKPVLDDGPSSSSSSRSKSLAVRKNVEGFVLGPSFDTNYVSRGQEELSISMASAVMTRRRRARQCPPLLPYESRPVRHRAGDDPPRASRRHLLHRPRRADRSGARHRRRPRAGRMSTSASAQELGLDLPLIEQFCHLREEGR